MRSLKLGIEKCFLHTFCVILYLIPNLLADISPTRRNGVTVNLYEDNKHVKKKNKICNESIKTLRRSVK